MSKYIDLTSIPKKGNRFDWAHSIGCSVPFVYGDITDNIVIIDYDLNKYKLTLKYKNQMHSMTIHNFTKCRIGVLLSANKCNHHYKFNNGDTIGNLKLLIQIRMNKNNSKGYVYQCLKDGYIGRITENDLINGLRCPVCSNRKVLKGINDMWTTNPELAKLLVNPEDGYRYTRQSNKYTDWKCPICGNIINHKQICKIDTRGLSCPKCSDGISYPEKFMYILLQQLNIDFEYQYSPKWCKYKFKGKNRTGRYDFYIPSKQIIIEMDGGLGHGNKGTNQLTIKESRIVDSIKDYLADENNIQVIRINCAYELHKEFSRFEYIKNNILHNSVFNFNANINFEKIDKMCQTSIVYDVCTYYNKHSNLSTQQIGKIFKLSKNSIGGYLKQGTKFGWCNYNPKEQQRKCGLNIAGHNKIKIVCLNTQCVYESIASAAKETGVNNIGACCKHRLKYAGKLHGEPLVWMYQTEYEVKKAEQKKKFDIEIK